MHRREPLACRPALPLPSRAGLAAWLCLPLLAIGALYPAARSASAAPSIAATHAGSPALRAAAGGQQSAGTIGRSWCWASVGQGFCGWWTNQDPNANDIVKVIISGYGGKFSIHAFGACEPVLCDWGEVPLQVQGPSQAAASFTWNFAVASLTLSLSGRTLTAVDHTHFTDNSGRPDLTVVNVFSSAGFRRSD